MILALGAIAWLLYESAGGGEADGVIPQSYQQSLDKASGVQDMVDSAALQRARELEQRE
jgi:hypothetical protein